MDQLFPLEQQQHQCAYSSSQAERSIATNIYQLADENKFACPALVDSDRSFCWTNVRATGGGQVAVDEK